MFEAVVYFAGPATVWAGEPDEREIVARFESRFRVVAQAKAVSLLKRLNAGRCGWVMYDGDGKVLDSAPADELAVSPL